MSKVNDNIYRYQKLIFKKFWWRVSLRSPRFNSWSFFHHSSKYRRKSIISWRRSWTRYQYQQNWNFWHSSKYMGGSWRVSVSQRVRFRYLNSVFPFLTCSIIFKHSFVRNRYNCSRSSYYRRQLLWWQWLYSCNNCCLLQQIRLEQTGRLTITS